MADINAADLTAETLNSLDGTENIVAFDTAEGKKIPLSVLGDYVVQKLTQTLLGQTQTVQNALNNLLGATPVINSTYYTAIPANADLDDYKTVGVYGVSSNATARSLSNCPVEQSFRMVVEDRSTTASETGSYRYKRQILYHFNSNDVYMRRMSTSNAGETWSITNWEKVPTRTEIDKISGIVAMASPDSMTSYSTQQFTVASSSRHLIIISGAKSAVHGLLLVSANSSGEVFLTSIHAGDGLVITAPSNNILQVQNTSNVACYFTDICTNGTAITKVTEPSS